MQGSIKMDILLYYKQIIILNKFGSKPFTNGKYLGFELFQIFAEFWTILV